MDARNHKETPASLGAIGPIAPPRRPLGKTSSAISNHLRGQKTRTRPNEPNLPEFQVAEDGSTYWGLTSGFVYSPPTMRACWSMDAWHSLRWRSGNRLRSAYDGRVAAYGSGAAKSPAIDSGSRDFLNAGTTKTDLTVDNPTPTVFGNPDNLDINGNPGPWNDSNKHLDMGYHYGAATQRVGTGEPPVYVYTTLRYPKERIPSFSYGIYPVIQPNVGERHELALAAGGYSAALSSDLAVAVFRTDTNIFGYHVFRGGASYTGALAEVEETPGVHVATYAAVAATAGSPTTDPPSEGTIYAAVQSWEKILSTPYAVVQRIVVLRYDTSSNTWTVIGQTAPSGYGFDQDHIPTWPRIALAAQGTDVWAFWIEPYPISSTEVHAKMFGCRVEQTMTPVEFVGIPYPGLTFDLSRVDVQSDWDIQLGGDYQGAPRISWVDADFPGTNEYVWEAQVPLDRETGQPTGSFGNDATAIELGFLPALAINEYDTVRFAIPSAPRAFARFLDRDGTGVFLSTLTVDAEGDHWQEPPDLVEPDGAEATVSYRAFGAERAVVRVPEGLKDSATGLFTQAQTGATIPKLATGRARKDNVYFAHRGAASSQVDVYQLQT